MNGNYKEDRRNNCRSIFLPLSVQNLSILGLTELKPCTFFTPKRLKPLSVNTFRVNQQALIKDIKKPPTGVNKNHLLHVQNTIFWIKTEPKCKAKRTK